MNNQGKTALQAIAKAAYFKQLQSHFNPVSQLKQRFIRLMSVLI